MAEISSDGGVALADGHSVVDDAPAIVARAVEAFGRVDVLINNAGIGTAVPALREDPDDFRKVIDVNLNGAYWMAQACGRVMPPGSSIVNIAIGGGIFRAPGTMEVTGRLGAAFDNMPGDSSGR